MADADEVDIQNEKSREAEFLRKWPHLLKPGPQPWNDGIGGTAENNHGLIFCRGCLERQRRLTTGTVLERLVSVTETFLDDLQALSRQTPEVEPWFDREDDL